MEAHRYQPGFAVALALLQDAGLFRGGFECIGGLLGFTMAMLALQCIQDSLSCPYSSGALGLCCGHLGTDAITNVLRRDGSISFGSGK